MGPLTQHCGALCLLPTTGPPCQQHPNPTPLVLLQSLWVPPRVATNTHHPQQHGNSTHPRERTRKAGVGQPLCRDRAPRAPAADWTYCLHPGRMAIARQPPQFCTLLWGWDVEHGTAYRRVCCHRHPPRGVGRGAGISGTWGGGVWDAGVGWEWCGCDATGGQV